MIENEELTRENNEEFRTEEVREVIRRLRRGKTAKHDDIISEMLQNLENAGTEVLINYWINFLTIHTYPRSGNWE